MALPIIENRTLLGLDTITPLVDTTYAYSYSAGTQPLTNNVVRLLCDSALAVPTIELPAIASFNGDLEVQILIQDQTGNAVVKPIFVNVGTASGDRINTSATGWKITENYGSIILRIASSGHWIATGGVTQ
jgi:hypothetical protein